MSIWERLRSRLPVLPGRRERLRALERELVAHLELEAEEQREAGLSPAEARYAARRAFGNVTLIQEELRAIWTWGWLDRLARDVRYATRLLRKSPGFALVAVLTLALGIGANTLIFSVVEALTLRPLPFPAADRLVRIYSTRGEGPAGGSPELVGPSPLDVRDLAQGSHSFQQMVAYDAWRKNVSLGDAASEPEQMRVGLVPAAYFETLGVQPIMGRLFTDEENQEGRHYVAAISERLWRSRFAGDRAILGRKVRINDEPYAIVAVMPDVIPEWMEPGRPGLIEVWTPFALPRVWLEASRGGRGDAAIARLKPRVSLAQAEADLATVAARLAAAHPLDRGIGVAIRRIADTRAGELRPMLLLLTGAVSLILLIACVNLANLLLARNSARQRELTVRAALGAGRGGLVQQLLAETPGQPVTRTQDIPSAQFGLADAHFLRTLGIPLLRGRDFAAADDAGSRPVALVSEELARRYFPAADPVGRQFHIGPPPFLQIGPGANTMDSADVTIVGIIGDFKNAGLALPAEPQVVVLYSQHPVVNFGFKDIVLRTALAPHAIAPALRRQLHQLDPDMPLAEVQTMDELVEGQTAGQRFTTVLLACFAFAGLALAIVGIYGVVSFLVEQRRQELAVRIALGAGRGTVLRLVLQHSMAMAALGTAVGLCGAWASQKLTSGLLFGISPVDPPTLAGAAGLLLAVAAVASTIPAARVLRIDPVAALRQD